MIINNNNKPGQIREKSCDTVKRVPLTKNRWRAPFVARNRSECIRWSKQQWSFACLVPRPYYTARTLPFGSRGPFVSDTSPKGIDLEGLGRLPTETRQGRSGDVAVNKDSTVFKIVLFCFVWFFFFFNSVRSS